MIVLLAVSACTTPVPTPTREGVKEAWAQTDGVRYRCEGGKGFVASFKPDATRAAIKLGETVYEVPQKMSGSGIHYKSDVIDFIGKGREAQLLQSPDGAYENCIVLEGN